MGGVSVPLLTLLLQGLRAAASSPLIQELIHRVKELMHTLSIRPLKLLHARKNKQTLKHSINTDEEMVLAASDAFAKINS